MSEHIYLYTLSEHWNPLESLSDIGSWDPPLEPVIQQVWDGALLLFSHSVGSNSLRPHRLQYQASLSFTISRSLLKPMSIESVMPSNHLILSHPLLLLPSIFPSIRVFSNELALRIRWPKYWSFSFSISLSNQYSGLISFRICQVSVCSSVRSHHNKDLE